MQEVVSSGDVFALLSTLAEDTGEVTTTIDDTNLLQLIADKLETTNTLLLRMTNQWDILLAVVIVVIIIAVFYTILKSFTRF